MSRASRSRDDDHVIRITRVFSRRQSNHQEAIQYALKSGILRKAKFRALGQKLLSKAMPTHQFDLAYQMAEAQDHETWLAMHRGGEA